MKKVITTLGILFSGVIMAQTGHLMQGIGSVNMSMGGASTGQVIDISGALQWNPAGITEFSGNDLSVSAGLFMSNPKLSSSFNNGTATMSGTTEDQKPNSVMPAVAFTFGKNDKHKFGVSIFGVSGFGVEYPEDMTNPVLAPQQYGGFGNLESNYMLMQVGFAYAYKLSNNLSIGIQPNINYSSLKIHPNPLAGPSMTMGYPNSDNASAFGFGAQFGVYYKSDSGFKLGASYKTPVFFNEFKFDNTYLDGSAAPENKFRMDFPAIYSIGTGYSNKMIDLALDYRYVDYENTKGFKTTGWNMNGSIAGFGWQNMSIVSAGLQYKGFEKFPIRVGYTYSSNPIKPELAMFSIPASAIIKHAYEFGVGYKATPKLTINANYHYGTSAGSTTGQLLNPMMASPSNPYGAIPGSSVSYEMNTSMVQLGVDYHF
ncbi:hypothetical protein GCM10010992_05210 [Cloacibacterium rupense]|uniref:Long-chain fatty acid transport protein n=1 Tax=Cloacibacterium rupense TaxID=517423 RepID=A0ABQ2NHA5_9FLAO|nr:outer membrane protein transport protein [Cloacibacterium rupense]GGP02116.1 hypothetical protein GCM10010992_05210 [Cloacibacterium rupense]